MDKLHSILPEYVILEKLKDEIEVRSATKDEIEPFVQKHYLHKFPTGTKAMYGIFRKPTNEMIGMIIYGRPFPAVHKALAKLGQPDDILELKRLFIDDVGLRNAESFVIGQSLKLLQHDLPNLRVVITFADSKAGHVGGIYQATNATYIGQSADGKHRYLYFMGKDADKMKAMVDAKPYPKKPETQLDKAIAEAEAHMPGIVRRNFWNFGMLVNDPGRGIKEWRPSGLNFNLNNWMVNEAAEKEDPKEIAVRRLFLMPFQVFTEKCLVVHDLTQLLRKPDVKAQAIAIQPHYVRFVLLVPFKYWRASVLDEIMDNPVRAQRDLSNYVERALHTTRIKLDLDFDNRIEGSVVIAWKCATAGFAQQLGGDPTTNQ